MGKPSTVLLWALCVLFIPYASFAANTEQTLNLQQGWNAVWLEVNPVNVDGTNKTVASVFADNAIEVVAMPMNPVGTLEFISDPNDVLVNRLGWQVWYRNSELGVSTLGIVQGDRGYLVKTSASVTLNISGTARYHEMQWEPNRYNLVGFGLNTNTTTFGQFFGDVLAQHPLNRIFQLNPATGNWEGVSSSTVMESGRAYWIYSEGKSDFTGPVKVSFDGLDGIDFSDTSATTQIPDPESNTGGKLNVTLQELVLTNVSDRAQTVTLKKVSPDTGANSINDDLRIFDVVPTPGTLTYEAGEGLLNNTPYSVASQTSIIATLGADRNWNSGAESRENLYKIEFEYHYAWLSVAADNSNLSDAVVNVVSPEGAGLWVGEVIVDEVTSLTEAGRPVTKATSSAPLRLILHSDANGKVSLLPHVMLMQTKTADETVIPEPLLLINEEKIPFYEGIEERGGKRVGIRIESTSYDMPRDYNATAQEAIRTLVGDFIRQTDASFLDANVTPDHVQIWVERQVTRPPALEENYHLSFPLVGAIGVNQELRTAEPFTDSNQDGVFGEPFIDTDGNGRWDDTRTEVYTDLNNNNVHDASDEAFTDTNGNGTFDLLAPAEPYVDNNPANGQLDSDPYIDVDGNGVHTMNLNPEKDFVFHDADLDKVYDIGVETAYPNWELINSVNGYRLTDLTFYSTLSNLEAWHSLIQIWWHDNDGNGIFDPGFPEPIHDLNANAFGLGKEAFTDTNGNGLYDFDRYEPFVDTNNDGVRTLAEPFTDLNNNGTFDGTIPAEYYQDVDSNMAYTEEPYTDANNNGQWDGAFLTLDAFHRSNPFRHAFHPSHTVGRQIARNIVIQFDSTGSSDILRGTYTETVIGLGAVPLISKGTIALQRVTLTSTLVK